MTDTSTEALVRMVNQIADNYSALAPDVAVRAVANHLRQFWAPSMRAELIRWCDAGGDGLEDTSRAAAELLRAG